MAVLELGRRPDLLQVRLTPDSGFRTILTAPEATPFVEPPLLRFEIAGTPPTSLDWVSTLTLPNEATWAVAPEAITALLAAKPTTHVQLMYGDQVWAEGLFEIVD